MRILHLGTDSYGGHGGIALYNRELIAAMASHPAVEEVVVLPRVIVNPPEVVPPKVTFIARAAEGKVSYMREVWASRRAKFDLVVCAHTNLLPIARMVTRRPLLLIYGIEAWKPFRDVVSKRILTSVRAVVSISDITLQRFTGWSRYGGTTHLLPNSIRAGSYGIRPMNADLTARYGISGKRVVLTVGRVAGAERYKGFDEVLEVLPHLGPEVVYLIAGGGDDVLRLQKKAARLGVAERVIFTGLFPEDEKADLYNLADVYVMPSRGEGFGFVFLEAMACGVPVVASRLDGGREAVRHGELGHLVDPTNPAEIETAIHDGLSERKAIPAGLDFFSFEQFERRTHAIIDAERMNA